MYYEVRLREMDDMTLKEEFVARALEDGADSEAKYLMARAELRRRNSQVLIIIHSDDMNLCRHAVVPAVRLEGYTLDAIDRKDVNTKSLRSHYRGQIFTIFARLGLMTSEIPDECRVSPDLRGCL